ECSFQGIILLGIANDNRDQIFIEFQHEDPRITKLEHNIFDFFRNYKIELSMNGLSQEAVKEKLYKKWGEKFWRIHDHLEK
ncbi:MAG: hypothetical protein AAGK97_07985, partial [Bacteroidota bacterium]